MAFGVDNSPQVDATELGGNLSQKQFAQYIARLQQAGSDEKDLAKKMLKKYGGQIDPAFLASAGVEMPKKGKNLFQQALTIASPVLNVINRPSQVALATIKAGASAVREGLGGQELAGNEGFGGIVKAATGHGDLNLRSAIGQDPNAGGRLAGFFDFAGTAATDPLTYLTAGTSKAVEAGLGALGKAGLEESAQQITRAGFKSLAPEAQAAARTAIEASPEIGRIAPSGFRRLGERVGLAQPLGAEEQAARNAENVLSGLERGGQKGFKLAGKTFAPIGEPSIPALAPLRQPVEAALAPVKAGLKRAGEVLGGARVPIERTYGKAVADAVHTVDQRLQGAKFLGEKDVARRFGMIKNEALKTVTADERRIISEALNTGAMNEVRSQLSEGGQKLMDSLDQIRPESVQALSQGVEAAGGKIRAARPNEELTQIKDTAFQKATTELEQKAVAPIEKLQSAAKDLRSTAEEAKAKLSNAQADYMAREAEVGKGRLPQAEGERVAVLKERARVAESAAKTAEAKVGAATEKAAARLEKIPTIATKAGELARDKAALSEAFLKQSTEYLKNNVLTDEGRRAFAEVEKAAPSSPAVRKLQGDLAALNRGGSAKNRTLTMSIPERNKHWAEALDKQGIKTSGNIFEEDPIHLVAQSTLDTTRAVAETQYLADLTKINDGNGVPMALTGPGAEKQAKELGYVKVPANTVEAVYAPQVLVDHMKQLHHVLYNDADLKKISDVIDKWGGTWAALATNFNAPRRFAGDLFNNFLDGVKNPAMYKRALKMQLADRAAGIETGRAIGKEWEESFIKHLGVNAKDAEIYKEAIQRSSESGGLLGADLQVKGRDIISGKPKKGILKNPIMDAGSRFNRLEEGNVRLANFIHNFEKTGSYDLAQKHVNTFLFDYTDLSGTEKAIKKYARFYTYLRNNTPLQVRMMIEKPGIYSNYFRAQKGAIPSGIVPQYSIDKGDIGFGKNMIGLGLPVEDAIGNLTPLAQLAGVIPGVKNLVPEAVRPEGGVGQVLRGAIKPITGGPVELAKAAVEQITGKSLFTGQDLSKNDWKRAQQVFQGLVPVASKAKGGLNATNVLSKILNVNITPVNAQTTKSELNRRSAILADAIAKATANGAYIPTYQDLLDAQLVPSTKEAKKILAAADLKVSQTKPKQTKAEKKRAALLKIGGG